MTTIEPFALAGTLLLAAVILAIGPGWRRVRGALAYVALFAGCSAAGCAGLSPGAKVGIEAAFAAVCPAEAMIPVVGAVAAGACPGEEAALAAALAAIPSPAPASTVPAATVPLVRVGSAAERPLVPVGRIAPGPHADVVQRILLAAPAPDAGVAPIPPPSPAASSAPSASPSLPPPLAPGPPKPQPAIAAMPPTAALPLRQPLPQPARVVVPVDAGKDGTP